jgi:hypothetical protein
LSEAAWQTAEITRKRHLDLVEVFLSADEGRGQLDDGVSPVVSPAVPAQHVNPDRKAVTFVFWETGSHRPLSNRALERKPRKSCSLSSLLNDSRVSLFLTISIPQKNPAPLMSPTIGMSYNFSSVF